MDISERSPVKAHWYGYSSSTTPISKVYRPLTLSTTSVTLPMRSDAPFNRSRVDHSCSRMVWCSRTRACRTDDLPEALPPESSVRKPSGSLSNSKHLKNRRSTRVSTEHLLEHRRSLHKPTPDIADVVRSVGNGGYELVIGEERIKGFPKSICSVIDSVFGIMRQPSRHNIPERRINHATVFLACGVLPESMFAEQLVVVDEAGAKLSRELLKSILVAAVHVLECSCQE